MSPPGRRFRGGGIMAALSFRIIFSATSACSTASAASKCSRLRLPLSRASLWHRTQYRWMTAVWASAVRESAPA